jgi:hypothetical protein
MSDPADDGLMPVKAGALPGSHWVTARNRTTNLRSYDIHKKREEIMAMQYAKKLQRLQRLREETAQAEVTAVSFVFRSTISRRRQCCSLLSKIRSLPFR